MLSKQSTSQLSCSRNRRFTPGEKEGKNENKKKLGISSCIGRVGYTPLFL